MTNELHTDDLDHAIALLTNDVTAHVIEWSREAKTLQDSITFKMRVDALRVLVDLKRTPPELGGAPLADTVRQLGDNLAELSERLAQHDRRIDAVDNRLDGGGGGIQALRDRIDLDLKAISNVVTGLGDQTRQSLRRHEDNVDSIASDVRRNSSELENHCHRLANLEQVTQLLAVEKRSTDD